MLLTDLFHKHEIDPVKTLIFRHRPHEAQLRRVFPWIIAERPDLFNAYQSCQGQSVEKAMKALSGDGHVASFYGHEPGKATFVGLYAIESYVSFTYDQFWKDRAQRELGTFGMSGWSVRGPKSLRALNFKLTPIDFYKDWRGRLIIEFPPPELSWWRRAHRNEFRVLAVTEESTFGLALPPWESIDLSWSELRVLPSSWKAAFGQWRGIYFIFDTSIKKGYVGAAYGEQNILGRWLNYAAKGHGGNKYLKPRNPKNFRFSILQRVSPDMNAADVIRLESTWKDRLHTRYPFGLNDN